jgi:RNA polymerase sigma-70 factor (ECF subfamily)
VNSALQRARESVDGRRDARHTAGSAGGSASTAVRELLARYIEAWELADVGKLVSLLHEDATLAMPPFSEWLQGAGAIGGAIGAMVFADLGPGAIAMVETEANGVPALAAFFRDPATGAFVPRSLHLLEIAQGRIQSFTAFLDASLVERFATLDR